MDKVESIQKHWGVKQANNLRFQAIDARGYTYQHASLGLSLFTLQFIPESDRRDLTKRIHDGLVEGGAFIIAEKVHAESARFQDMFSFAYYDFKRRNFSPDEILAKERDLRRQMHLWTETRLVKALREAGFQTQNIHRFWQRYLFVGYVAVKTACAASPTRYRT